MSQPGYIPLDDLPPGSGGNNPTFEHSYQHGEARNSAPPPNYVSYEVPPTAPAGYGEERSWFHEYLDDEKSQLQRYWREIHHQLFTTEGWKHFLHLLLLNWKSGITVALVNMPLSISLAVAANSQPVAGVLTAIYSGLIMALFGGCIFNIVGPTGALSGVLAKIVVQFSQQLNQTTEMSGSGSYHESITDPYCQESVLPYLSIVAGLICFVVFLLRWEQYVLLVPSSVTEGFTLGVAFIIALNQMNFAFGLKGIPRHEEFVVNVYNTFAHLGHTYLPAFIIFIVGLVALLVLLHFFPKIPWVIFIALIGITIGFLNSKGYLPLSELQTLGSVYNMTFVPFAFHAPCKSYLTAVNFYEAAFSVAFIAVLETLISAKIADGLTRTEFKQRREVFAIALGNVVVGIVGGIPTTAALARTSLNIKSGATSRVSGLVNVVMTLILSVVLLGIFSNLPLATVASMVVVVAYRMVDFHHLITFWHVDKLVFFTTILIALICIVADPTTGIVVGMVIALLRFSREISNVHSELILKGDGEEAYVSAGELNSELKKSMSSFDAIKTAKLRTGEEEEMHSDIDTLVYRISGQLTYVNSFSHKKRLQFFTSCQNIIISLRYLFFMDIDGLIALRDIVRQLHEQGKRVMLAGITQAITQQMWTQDWFMNMSARGQVFNTFQDALLAVQEESEEAALARGVAAGTSYGTARYVNVSNY